MKKNIVKYTEDVAELLRQKGKYHLSDDVYEKRLKEAKLRNGMLTQEDLGETSQKVSGSQKERIPEEERVIKEFFESKELKNRFIYSVITATLLRAKNCEIQDEDVNKPTVCFTRKPGMIVSYENVGVWTSSISTIYPVGKKPVKYDRKRRKK